MSCATIDSNTFIYAYLNKIDIFDLLEEAGIREILIPSKLIEEFERLENKLSGKERNAIIFAKEIVKKRCRTVEVDACDADTALLIVAKSFDCVLVTSDKALIEKAEKEGVEIAFIRSARKIEFKSGYGL